MDQQNCCYYSYDCRNNCTIDQGLFENKVVRLNEATPRTTLKRRRTTKGLEVATLLPVTLTVRSVNLPYMEVQCVQIGR